ncbi:imm11 family protein [Pseudomonas folii]|uniref:Immunity MXAN-0049 protein domain-containing protein n=1 Tax=Pseudomonas folii TaxID=2762593 RepID=A0ABR7B3L6_9PSED|nr:DUF1629 domain-containing protein [Pseudomonas folii]MBC3951773.1 hypothetical protein [Pseudomonas folii]
MQYYILRHEDAAGRFVDADVEFIPTLPEYYQVGKKFSLAGTRVNLTLDKRVKKLKADFFLATCGAFFVSKPLKEILSNHDVDLNFLLVNSSYFDGSTTENRYFLVHTENKLICFDYVNSEYSGKSMVLDRIANGELSTDYQVRGIKKLCINEQEVRGLDFFFVDKIIWIDPLISETVVNAARDSGIRLNVEKIY